MMRLRQSAVCGLAAASLAACASTGTNVAAPLKELPPSDVFLTAVRDICFGALDRGLSHAAVAEEAQFAVSTGISDSLRQGADEKIYTAEFASSPVIVSIMDEGTRCSVTAVRGDYEELKALSEGEIEAFSNKYGRNAPNHLSFVESDPELDYVLKFTLLTGGALETEDN